MSILKVLLLATRPWSFLMTIVSPSLGLILAIHNGSPDLILFPLVLIGLISAHAAANMVNDLYDVKHEVDNPSSPTAKYRRHYLLTGELSTSKFILEIVFFYALAISTAIYLTIIKGWIVLFFTLAGAFLTYAYTADPVKLKHLALGEIAVFLAWGPLMTTGTYYVLTGRLSFTPVYASIPVGLFVALVLFANNLRDIEYDKSAGVKTLANILGREKALAFYKYTLISIYVSLGILVALRVFSIYALLAYLTIPKAVRLVKTFYEKIPDASDPMTAQLSFNFGLLIIIGEIINWLIQLII
nr:prenyltransferase [Aigarchaeota archaeon]MCX8193237.1 prenyltransferase [Nitrososphaeria archaeon]MDW7986377.1 prenyltransferase [Nitrososphaerota archaeon]